MSKAIADSRSPEGAVLPPVLPMAPEGAALVREVAARCLAPGVGNRPSGRMPARVEAMLRLLADQALQGGRPGAGVDRRPWRRAAIQGLQGRHPEAMASFRHFARRLARQGAEGHSSVVVIIITIVGGVHAWEGYRDLEGRA